MPIFFKGESAVGRKESARECSTASKVSFVHPIPQSTSKFDGEKFFTIDNGAKRATPLLLCLLCIELSDFVFAADSIPAVLGVSNE